MIDEPTRSFVRRRARWRCEYCQFAQVDSSAALFHVEHITPRKHGGSDSLENLALACYFCNLHKGSNLSGIDPRTGVVVVLFHPRGDRWNEHFARKGDRIAGKSPPGRATVQVLNMNDESRRSLRARLRLVAPPRRPRGAR